MPAEERPKGPAPSDAERPLTGGAEDLDVLDCRTRYQGFFRLLEYTLRHRLFRGGWSPPFTRELFDRGPAVAVLLYDPIKDTVVLVEQFRVGTLGSPGPYWMLETVAGIVDPGETPEQVARREALEEAGCTVTALERIGSYFPSPGGSSEVITLFCGRTDSHGAGGIHGLPDEHEDIRVVVLPALETVEMLDRNELRNAATIIAVGWLARHRDRLRAAWSGVA